MRLVEKTKFAIKFDEGCRDCTFDIDPDKLSERDQKIAELLKRDPYIKRMGRDKKIVELDAKSTDRLLPNDTLYIRESWF